MIKKEQSQYTIDLKDYITAKTAAQAKLHYHHPFVPGVLINLFIFLEPGLFSQQARLSRFLHPVSLLLLKLTSVANLTYYVLFLRMQRCYSNWFYLIFTHFGVA